MPKRTIADLSPADRMRYQLMQLGTSQRGAARMLGIDSRTMRKYCSGQSVPRVIDLAMQGLIAIKVEAEDRNALRERRSKLSKAREGQLAEPVTGG